MTTNCGTTKDHKVMQEKMIDFYNTNAVSFDAEQDEFGFIRVPEWVIANKTIKEVARKDHSVLEIGAGTGRFTLEMAPLVRKVTAVDIAANMLDSMSRKMAAQGIINIEQRCGDFMALPFNETFNLIVGFSAIEYIIGKEALFAKIGGLLAPGGHVVFTAPHDTFFRWWGRMGNYYRQGIFMEAYRKSEARRLLTANGMEAVTLTDLCMKTPVSKGVLLFIHAKKQG